MEYITTEEFKKEVEKLGYEIRKRRAWLEVYSTQHKIQVAFVDVTTPYKLVTDIPFKTDMTPKLFNLCVRYANTPLDKREPEKKYYLKLDVSDKIKDFHNYLNYDKDNDYYLTSDEDDWNDYYKVKFTQSEIDELEKQGLTKNFRKVEVDEL